MTRIFDGKSFVKQKEDNLRKRAEDLSGLGVTPKLVSIIVGDNPASILYVNLKKKAAERIGAEVEIKKFNEDVNFDLLIQEIRRLNSDKSVHGIMIQLPLPEKFSRKERDSIIDTISEEKDVDGLRKNSKFTPPTAKAVLYILSISEEYSHFGKYPVVISIVGAKGFIGGQIVKALQDLHLGSYKIIAVDRKTPNYEQILQNSDVLISVTGSPGIIGKNEIKKGATVIDVGSPKGDVKTDEVLGKAAFISPVPGGVGPVTIVCLLENLVEAVSGARP
jgi:methylenetetrahydrofolate dehydrogenase (NADP+)/methenyltetrahydrofolate cyclohydrolase